MQLKDNDSILIPVRNQLVKIAWIDKRNTDTVLVTSVRRRKNLLFTQVTVFTPFGSGRHGNTTYDIDSINQIVELGPIMDTKAIFKF